MKKKKKTHYCSDDDGGSTFITIFCRPSAKYPRGEFEITDNISKTTCERCRKELNAYQKQMIAGAPDIKFEENE